MIKPLTYAATGVDYKSLDNFKKLAQKAAAVTAKNLGKNFHPIE